VDHLELLEEALVILARLPHQNTQTHIHHKAASS
jgi:hypothetical protein